MRRRLIPRLLAFGAALPALAGCGRFETRMIFPGTATHARADTTLSSSPDYELVQLTLPDGTRIVAQYGHAFSANREAVSLAHSQPALLFFYGNAT